MTGLESALAEATGDLDPGRAADPERKLFDEMDALINRLLGYRFEIALVLDHFQEIVDPEIQGALGFLLDYLPPNLHL